MSKGLLASIAVLMAGATAAFGQTPAAPATATGPVIASPVVASGPAAGSPILTTAPIEVPVMNGYPNGYPNGCMTGCAPGGLMTTATVTDCPWYGRADDLVFWTKAMPNSTPMVTSVAPGTPTGGTPVPGAVGGAGTSVIMGGSDEDLGTRQGGRFTLGRYFDAQQTVAIEGSYFFLGSASDSQSAISLGGPSAPTLMIPFKDVTGTFTGGTPGQSACLAGIRPALPRHGRPHGPFISHDNLYFKSEVQGADGYGVFNITKSGRLRVDALFGFRWLNLERARGLQLNQRDRQLRSGAHRLQLGRLRSRRATTSTAAWSGCGPNTLRTTVQGAGAADSAIAVPSCSHWATRSSGSTSTVEATTNLGNPPTASNINYAGGVFAQPTNMGAHDADHFAFVPEGDFAVGYAFASWGRVMLGYDVIYISDVARPGDQIEPGVNVYRSGVVQGASPPIAAPATDPGRPSFTAAQSTFWAQGLTIGVELHF